MKGLQLKLTGLKIGTSEIEYTSKYKYTLDFLKFDIFFGKEFKSEKIVIYRC